ncbi:TetR family transcriptional regulator [Gordonia amarae]|uniref:TetR family transcriptional regulator n=2 Tax=Gordonia amarae TaxID=36821 RepID=A0A857L085_9ACTN|nr:TetR/AcrR family transcriptional regulator [Gordonia amarae]MCS3880044.1 AcrR family transcriptional regulator [Gordonia amarae]QHN18424.1 TetR family transcriptional regulator [Gordonia amarae]QHN22906.1 TetR family transcriptional regulator [Gordonia amarae]QHN31809.1 TetR family transcriptional regulator [Gordonia amarae]QHN40555.1 TetR family transcriptional regulator [Gordonia amarae]
MSGKPAQVSRGDRRKAKTRAALIGAAVGFLSEGRTSVSIQEITDAADVGFGTFYNHFDTKEDLFAAAVTATLDGWAALRARATAGLVDPAEIFARSFRVAGRLQPVHPTMVRLVLNSGAQVLSSEHGLRPGAVEDIGRGIESGRFAVRDVDAAVMMAGGLLLALLQMLESTDAPAGSTADLFAERALVMLGVASDEAHDICHRELPDISVEL